MVRIAYNTGYDLQTGEVTFITECQYKVGIMVGSDDCIKCIYFHAITFKQQVECYHPVETVSVEADGFSETGSYNLSPRERKPVQMRIPFK